MRVERLVESSPSVLDLSPTEADGLLAAGKRLASPARWWGQSDSDDDSERSVVACEPFGPGRWKVRVANAVGVVRVGDLQLVVEPKIPLSHLLYLFERSGAFPRLDSTDADLTSAATLWPLVAGWYVSALEHLLRWGLSNGYRESTGELAAARGHINPTSTTLLLLKGRAFVDCRFEDYDLDMPMNRVLRAAAGIVAASDTLDPALRRRARRAVDHMEGVTSLRPSDLAQAPDRQTSRYTPALDLARHVLQGTGRGLESGPEHGFAFLIRTPEMIETALRQIVSEALAEQVEVSKKTVLLKGSAHSLTPDLRFGSHAVGDVKYKLWPGDWPRADLYQLVAFATGFSVAEALRVGFASVPHSSALVSVGSISLRTCDWIAADDLAPAEAEAALVDALVTWWADSSSITNTVATQ